MRPALFLLMAVLLTGCREGSFLQRRYDDFTAHYNTFYNAKRQFDQGVRALERQEQPIDLERYIPVFLAQEQASRSPEFEKSITKSANLLREHPRSRWVDNALMLIGKSYFYRQEYVGAEQKFREVITLGGPHADEARFWLARSLVAAHAFDDANNLLDESLAREGLGRRWEALLRLVKGELHVQERNWEAAATELQAGLQSVRDNQVASRAQFLLGQVLETMERYSEAAEAYSHVDRFKPLYELSYAAKVSEIRSRGLHGQADRALAQLRRMKRDDKHFSYMPQLETLQARIHWAAGQYDEAFHIYDELLYDPDSKAAALRGRLHYGLAELYRDGYQDFFLAAAHFDTAATNLRTNRTSFDLTTPYAITEAREIADVFKSFRSIAERIMRSDSLLALGALDEAAFDSAVAAIQERRIQEAERRRADLARRMAENRFREAMGQGARSGATTAGQRSADAGFLNHRDADRFQEGVVQFRQIWGDRPRVDNWRRKGAITAALALRTGEGEGEGNGKAGEDALGLGVPPLDISEVPRDPVSISAMEAERAAARYELANVLFLSMNLPDSAATWYRLAIDEEDALEVAQRAYFALAEVQLALADTTAANRLYREILTRYPASNFAVRSRERLGLEPMETTPDSLTLAQSAYDAAFAAWRNGDHDDAFEAMLGVAVNFPKQPVAGQALLAVGLIHTQRVMLGEGDLFDEISVREGLLPAPPERDSTISVQPLPADTLAGLAGAEPGVSLDSLAAGTPDPSGAAIGMIEPPGLLAEAANGNGAPAADSSGGQGTPPPAPDPQATNMPAVPSTAKASEAATSQIDHYLAGVIPQPLTLETLYTSVQTHFTGTPVAERAQGLLKYLADQRAAAEAVEKEALAHAKSVADSLAALEAASRAPLPDSVSVPEGLEDGQGAEEGTGSDDAVPDDVEGGDVPGTPSDLPDVDPPAAIGTGDLRPSGDGRPPGEQDASPEAVRKRREQMLQSRGVRPTATDTTAAPGQPKGPPEQVPLP